MAFSFPGLRALWPTRGLGRTERPAAPAPPEKKTTSRKRRASRKPPAAQQAAKAPAPNTKDGGDATAEPAAKRTARTYAREAAALLFIASGLYVALALGSYRADPLRPELVGSNWVGPVGETLAAMTVKAVGVVAWLLPFELMLQSRPLLRDRKLKANIARLGGDVLIAVILASLAHIALPTVSVFGNMPLGGAVGDLFGSVLRGLFSTVGSFLIGLTVVALILVERSTFSFIELIQNAKDWLNRLRNRADDGVGAVASAWARARAVDKERREEERKAAEPLIASPEQADAIIAAFADDREGAARYSSPPARRSVAGDKPQTARVSRSHSDTGDAEPVETGQTRRAKADVDDEVATPSPIMPVTTAKPADEGETPSPCKPGAPIGKPPVKDRAAADESKADDGNKSAPARRKSRKKKAEQGPRIVDTSKAAQTAKSRKRRGDVDDGSGFRLPPTNLLNPNAEQLNATSEERLKETAKLLEKTLANYGVDGKVREIHPGPTVTMFEVSPAPGTKVSKVAGLADDLALGLSRKVRIVAPIPGKNRIGFEVPNERRVPVNLRDLIESRDFLEMKAPLPCVLGRALIGRPFFVDLAGMPHVIVAGATGAGKSVGLNVILVSLLYRRTPEEMRLLMIDPKVVELAPFDRIPHLLFPVVTDMKQASNALKWTVDEMERRYQLFADAGKRNIISYNIWAKKVRSGELPAPAPPKTVQAITPDGGQLEIPALKDGSDQSLPDKLPYIVVVVEEFADLMMQQGKEVEASVARLAQKARAAGIHVILATQRPSVDVITGMIKANFPTRIAYRVAQKVDSRTILDQQGAEHLLGRGDMLVKLNGTNEVRRVQCPFVSEQEVQSVTDLLRTQGEPDYDESIVLGTDDGADAKSDPDDAETDPLYDQAVRVVADTQKCSTSWIQRKLGIGYNRAARIVETMERNGLVGPPNGSKPRDILISPH